MDDGLKYQRAGQFEMACVAYAGATKHLPNDALVHFNYGQCLLQRGEIERALRQFEDAVRLAPEHHEYQTGLANAASVGARFDQALAAGRQAIAQNPKDGVAQYLVGYALEQLDEIEAATKHVELALEVLPADHQLQILRAHLVGRQGEKAGAVRGLREILNDAGLSGHYRQRAAHELGVLLDQMGEYDEAFQAFEICGEETARSAGAKKYDRGVRFRQIRSYRGSVTREIFEREDHLPDPAGLNEPGLAFLVGFPRSGTTLTEQVLAAHPAVITGDELPLITTVANQAREMLGGQLTAAAILKQLSTEQLLTLRERYWKEARAAVGEIDEQNTFVDKMPLNVIDLPLIRLIFPEAKILMALRDPRDVCLSCFMQDFRLNNSMIHFLRLKECAEFYESVMELYLHYVELAVFDIFAFRYEETVADLETQARGILGHLGLEWHADLLEFHRLARKRMISTPSAAAVRERIHGRAVKRFANYAGPIEEVLPHLTRFIECFGYEESADP